MIKRVELPNGEVADFPMDMDDNAIAAVLAKEFPAPKKVDTAKNSVMRDKPSAKQTSPVRPEYVTEVNNAFDNATPEQRKAMAKDSTSLMGRIAAERGTAYDRMDAGARESVTDKTINRLMNKPIGGIEMPKLVGTTNLADGRKEAPKAIAKPKETFRARSGTELAKDIALDLGVGVTNVVGAIPNLVAPEGEFAQATRETAESLRGMQSDTIQAQLERANQRIQEAGKAGGIDGVADQFGQALSEYGDNPGLAMSLIVQNIPSFLPGIGIGKLMQLAPKILPSLKFLASSGVPLTAAAITNAVQNAGSARGEAYEDLLQTQLDKNIPKSVAEDQANEGSILPAVAGGITGLVSGGTGLEGTLLSKAAAAPIRKGLTELGSEQAEELLPKVATNYEAGKFDNRSMLQDVGRTMAETTIASAPTAAGTALIDSYSDTKRVFKQVSDFISGGREMTPEMIKAKAALEKLEAKKAAQAPVDTPVDTIDPETGEIISQAQPGAVQVTFPSGDAFTGKAVESFEEDGQNFTKVVSDDGETYVLAEGEASIVPVTQSAQPGTPGEGPDGATQTTPEEAPSITQPIEQPVAQEAPVSDSPDLSQMSDDDLATMVKNAQDPKVRQQIAAERRKRREKMLAEESSLPLSGSEKPAALPKDLAGAKPRYSYGSKQFDVEFESDVDRAAYIAAQKNPSKRDADYLKFAMGATGMTEEQVRAHGQKVRDAIKGMAKDAEPGVLKVGKQTVTGSVASEKPASLAQSASDKPTKDKKYFDALTVPNMTDEELEQAKQFYPDGSKRLASIAKQQEKRRAEKPIEGPVELNPDEDESLPQYAGSYDKVYKGDVPEGWVKIGQNTDGNDIFEAGGARLVKDGDHYVREVSHKPRAERVVEFRTKEEVEKAYAGNKPTKTQQMEATGLTSKQDGFIPPTEGQRQRNAEMAENLKNIEQVISQSQIFKDIGAFDEGLALAKRIKSMEGTPEAKQAGEMLLLYAKAREADLKAGRNPDPEFFTGYLSKKISTLLDTTDSGKGKKQYTPVDAGQWEKQYSETAKNGFTKALPPGLVQAGVDVFNEANQQLADLGYGTDEESVQKLKEMGASLKGKVNSALSRRNVMQWLSVLAARRVENDRNPTERSARVLKRTEERLASIYGIDASKFPGVDSRVKVNATSEGENFQSRGADTRSKEILSKDQYSTELAESKWAKLSKAQREELTKEAGIYVDVSERDFEDLPSVAMNRLAKAMVKAGLYGGKKEAPKQAEAELEVPLSPYLENMGKTDRDLYKVDEAIEKAKTTDMGYIISDKPEPDNRSEAEYAFTPERAMFGFIRARDAMKDTDGMLRSNNRTGATRASLISSFIQANQMANSIRKSKQQNPELWAAYEARQAEVEKLGVGDEVVMPFGPAPTGKIEKKYPRRWKIVDKTGQTFMLEPSMIRPVDGQSKQDDMAAYEAEWTRTPTVNREAILKRAGLSLTLKNRAFKDIAGPGQKRIAAEMTGVDPASKHLYDGKTGWVLDEEAYQRKKLAEGEKSVGGDLLGQETANMFAKASLQEAKDSFDKDGKFIGKYKYRAVITKGRGGVFMFNDLETAKQFTDAYGQKKQPEPAQAREMGEGGRPKDGKPVQGGDVFKTLSGRTTTPYPTQKSEKYATQWLIDNAVAEAQSRGDDFNATAFGNEKPGKGGELPQASIESMQMYLFEQQPSVPKPMLKPLSSKEPSGDLLAQIERLEEEAQPVVGEATLIKAKELNALNEKLYSQNPKARDWFAKRPNEKLLQEPTRGEVERNRGEKIGLTYAVYSNGKNVRVRYIYDDGKFLDETGYRHPENITPTRVAAAIRGATYNISPPSEATKPNTDEFLQALSEIRKQLPDGFSIQLESGSLSLMQDGKFAVNGLGRTVAGAEEALRQAKLRDQKANLLPQSDSQAVNDFVSGKRDDAPTVEEVKTEQESLFANNKIFTADKVEAARALLKKKLGQLNSGVDPEVFQAGVTIAGAYVEAGIKKFADFSRAMVKDFGDEIRPYLRSFYEGVRYYPGVNNEGMSTAAEIDAVEKSQGSEKTLSTPEGRFAIAQQIADFFVGGGRFDTIVQARKKIEEITGQRVESATSGAKLADEVVETAVVLASREIVDSGRKMNRQPHIIYDRLVDLYSRQPNLAVRTSTSVAEQAYSTPAPLAFIASELAGITEKSKVYEPSAGNGMLLIGADVKNSIANELNDYRVNSLARVLDGAQIQNQDATQWAPSARSVDAVIQNPPFGIVKDETGQTMKFEISPDYVTSEIDHAIVFKSLEAMKDDGRAVLIVGGTMAKDEEGRAQDYRGKSKRTFYFNLYNQYNVVDHFTINGAMYSKQGASYPVDVIVIDGRGKSNRDLPAADVPKIIQNYTELKGKLDESYRLGTGKNGSANRTDSGGATTGQGNKANVDGSPARQSDQNGDAGTRVDARNQSGVDTNGNSSSAGQPGRSGAVPGGRELQSENAPNSGDAGPAGVSGGNRPEGKAGTSTSTGRNEPPKLDGTSVVSGERQQSGLTDRRGQEEETATQLAYAPKSGAASVGTLVPRAMADSIQKSLERIQEAKGDIDQFVADSLKMPIKSVKSNFSAEQIDALALAIDNAEKGSGFIIGDQTGIGKGRVVAAMIRYALVSGKTPIFVTEKPNLYSDMIRDLDDIGMTDELKLDTATPRILMTNGSESVPYTLIRTVEGEPVENNLTLKPPKRGKDLNDLFKKMQDDKSLGDYKVIFTTYSQLQTVKGAATERMNFVRTFGTGGYMIFDESHNAGGAGEPSQARTTEQREKAKKGESLIEGRAAFVRSMVEASNGSFFSSATYAKRPDVMDLYSSTNMRLAVDNISELGSAIKEGGVPMQQVVANMLTQDGQYIRRERTFAGVTYETKEAAVDRQTAENMAKAMRSILAFSRKKQYAVKQYQKELDKQGALVRSFQTEKTQVESANFGAIMHNLIDQMLLALKARQSVDFAIERLKQGEKVVMTVSNTMGSFLSEYAEQEGLSKGDVVSMTFGDMYLRYLEKQLEITVKLPNGEKRKQKMDPSILGEGLYSQFLAVKKQIEESEFGTAPISPIDYMKAELAKAGYKADEITGRTIALDYSTGTPTLTSRTASIKQRVKAVSGFNNGEIDVLILNQAGSTGLSLHASSKFKDKRKRHMIIVQPEKNIDTHMQMLGRVHRTGQVIAPAYSQMMAAIPAEMRPAAVLMKKMASLNANTTASRKSSVTAEGVVDFINEYGGQVAAEFLQDNPEVWASLGGSDVIKVPENAAEADEDLIRKLTGYIPVLPIAKQEEIYADLIQRYEELIERETSMGTNKLEAAAMDLDAKVLSSESISEDKGIDSIFAKPAYMEQLSVKRTVKPLSSEEVRAAMQKTLGEKNNIQFNKDLRSEVTKAAKDYLEESYKAFGETEDDLIKRGELTVRANAALSKIEMILDTYRVGDQITLTIGEGGNVVYGVITNIGKKGKSQSPVANSTFAMTVALANGDAKSIQIPFSKIGNGYSLQTTPRVNFYNPESQQFEMTPVSEIFDKGSTVRREKRWMVTGNILSGYSQFKGQITSYTKDDGTIAQGVLMSRSFDYAKFKSNAAYIFKNASEILSFIQNGYGNQVHSKDGVVKILRSGMDALLTVPSSKKDGGNYYLDKDLLRIIGRDFIKSGGTMQARVSSTDLQAVFDHLRSKHSVKLIAGTNNDVAKAMFSQKQADQDAPQMPGQRLYSIRGNVREMTRITKLFNNGKLTEASVPKLFERLIANRKVSVTANGELPISVKQMSAVMQWLFDRNPNIDKSIAEIIFDGTLESHVGGYYDSGPRNIVLNANKGSAIVGVHEVMHHTERMLPPDVQEKIRELWLRDWNKAFQKGDTETKDLLLDMAKASLGDDVAYQKVVDAFNKGDKFKVSDWYSLFSPSEYWAENGADYMLERATESWVQKAVRWMREFVAFLQNKLGMNDDYYLIKAFNYVLNQADGDFKSETLIKDSAETYFQGGKLMNLGDSSARSMFDPKEVQALNTPNHKGREKLIEMRIKDFLDLAEYEITPEKLKVTRQLVKEGRQFNELPFLQIDADGRVDGHEGRHRARALLEAGYKTMPVILRSANIRWSEQNDPEKRSYIESLPARIKAEKGALNERFSIAFPVNREDAMKPYVESFRLMNLSGNKRQTDTPEFKRWFGDSKVVDAEGKPLVVYHGTSADFTTFKKSGGTLFATKGGIYFSNRPEAAQQFAGSKSPNIMPVYLSLKNPYISNDFESDFDIQALKSRGFDGIIVKDADFLNERSEGTGAQNEEMYIAFEPTQIKSAIGNNGQFDPTNPSIVASIQSVKPAMNDLAKQFKAQTGDDIAVAGTKLAGQEVRRAAGKVEKDLYTPEQVAMVDQWEAMRNPSSKYLFHTTPAVNLQSIAKNGLKPGSKARFEGVGNGELSFGANEATSAYYGGASDVMLRVSNKFEFSKLNPDLLSGQGAYTTPDAIPASALEVKVGKKWVPLTEYAKGQNRVMSIQQKEASEEVAEAAVKIIDRQQKLATDLNRFESIAVHPRTIASFNKEFVPVYQAAVEQFEKRDQINAELTREMTGYTSLTAAQKEKVNKALEMGRLAGTNFRKAEDANLTPEEFEGYKAARRTMNVALDMFKAQFIREQGFDPNVIKTEQQILNLINEAMPESLKAQIMRSAEVIREIEQAKRQGYVPFTRYGQVGVYVKDDEGNTIHFEKVEIDGFKDKMRRLVGKDKVIENIPAVRDLMNRLAKKYPDANRIGAFEVGKQSKEEVNLADLDRLANVAEIDTDVWSEVSEALKMAAKAKGFRKHFFGSANVPGYSKDFERGLADYIVGISGYLARRQYNTKFDDAIAAIPATMPNMKAYADKYREYINTPTEEWQGIRQAAFLYYIAGNLSTAIVNISQQFMTKAYLTQFSAKGQPRWQMARANRDALKMFNPTLELFDPSKAPDDVKELVQRAWDSGLFVPLQTYENLGTAHNRSKVMRGMNEKVRKGIEIAALSFTAAERLNRIATFIATVRLAKTEGFQKKAKEVLKGNPLARSEVRGDDFAYKMAELVIDETHFRMGKVNRPTFMRGVGAPITQFKSFMVQTLELMVRTAALNGREGKLATLYILAVFLMLGGVFGVPFGEDLTAAAEAAYKKATGEDVDLKAEARLSLSKAVGPRVAELATSGLGPLAGVDLQSKAGMGDVVPMSVSDVLGIPLALTFGRLGDAMMYAKQERYEAMMGALLPNFAANALQAYEWATDGVRKKTTGQLVIKPEELSGPQLAGKAIGFTPSEVTAIRSAEYAISRENNKLKDKVASYHGRLGKVFADIQLAESTDEARELDKKAQEILAEVAEYNEGKELADQLILNDKSIQQAVEREMLGRFANDKRIRKAARGKAGDLREAFTGQYAEEAE